MIQCGRRRCEIRKKIGAIQYTINTNWARYRFAGYFCSRRRRDQRQRRCNCWRRCSQRGSDEANKYGTIDGWNTRKHCLNDSKLISVTIYAMNALLFFLMASTVRANFRLISWCTNYSRVALRLVAGVEPMAYLWLHWLSRTHRIAHAKWPQSLSEN